MLRSRVTTVDNPFDPFDDFKSWYAFDEHAGYHTTAYIARMWFSSSELSEADQERIMETLIDEIVSENITGVYRKVTREIP